MQNDPTDTTRVLEIPTGKNPRGIVINFDGPDRLRNELCLARRDRGGSHRVGRARHRDLQIGQPPAAGTPEDKIHVGKELYYTSVGEFDPATTGGAPITGRMSNNGWGSCGSCHPFGIVR